jgi:hypothetical protein
LLASIKVKIRLLDTPAQLEGAKKARAIIITVTRVLRIYTSLLKTLANNLVCIAARLLNITSTKSIN